MKNNVELLLLENVDNLGIVGDIVRVKPGYARNFLLPRGLATLPTEGQKNRLAARRAEIEQELARKRSVLEGMLDQIEGHEVTLERSCNDQGILYGGVSQHDVAEALQEAGFPLEDRMVRLGEQVKRLGDYDIPVQLAPDLRTQIKLWVVADRPLGDEEDFEEEVEEAAAEPAEAAEASEPAAEAETAG